MHISKQNLYKALKLASSDQWENGLPKVRAQLRLVINSLREQSRGKFPQDADSLNELITRPLNARIRAILRKEEITVEAFAFAIRDSLK